MKRTLLSLLILAFCAMAVWVWLEYGPADEGPRKPRFTIGKETTYVSGPLDKDGYIDYAAALNKRLSKGVTPENNANVLLWKAFGPHPEGRTAMPSAYFKLMGIQPPPERGEYFLSLWRYLLERLHLDPTGKQVSNIENQLELAGERPWTAKQYPHIAAWLKTNEKPLALVVEATKRPRYFSPLVPSRTEDGPTGLLKVLMPNVQACRDLGLALTARAMLRVSQGRYEEAWQDLLTCHRLGQCVAQGATVVEYLVGLAIDDLASDADLAFLEAAKLNAKQIRDHRRDLEKLPSWPLLADRADLGERFMLLDSVMMLARYGAEAFGSARPKKASPATRVEMDRINWDPALRNANRWYDRLVAALRTKDRAARDKKLDRFEKDWRTLKAEVEEVKGRLKKLGVLAGILGPGMAAEERDKWIGDMLITLVMAAWTKLQERVDRTEQIHRNLSVAFALAAYHKDNGHYPKTLESLAPKYLKHIPLDLFTGKPLIYRPNEKGYLLYSVGVNGQDEQGRSYEDDPPGDDLPVRMPLPKLRQR
jgi:hypothetical protein